MNADMKNIINYIEDKYNPISIIVYGSYYDGTNNQNSDFDALVISEISKSTHDVTFVDGVQLDLFVYPKSHFENTVDLSNFIQLFYSRIVKDSDDFGYNLKKSVIKYLEDLPYKTKDEVKIDILWCKKMLQRAKHNDAEGMFRWHWVLIESLKIFFDLKQVRYFGSKKSLKLMQDKYPNEYKRYTKALENFQIDYLEDWIKCLSESIEEKITQ